MSKDLVAEVHIDEHGIWSFKGLDQEHVARAFDYQLKNAEKEGRQGLMEELINGVVALGKKYA